MKIDIKKISDEGKLRSEISHLANNYISSYKPNKNTLKKHGILKRLKNNKDIVIIRPDKGSGVVILNRCDYDNMMYEIINDKDKFQELNTDPTLKREGQLQRFLLKLKKKGVFDKNEYKKIYPTGSMIAKIYGLPKTHKLNDNNRKLKLRPIVSAIGSYNYHLADYLSKKLSPYIEDKYTTKDTFSFVKELSSKRSDDTFLISYDVTSLFTNIPLQETLDIAVDKILRNEPDLKINKKELKQLFIFATSQSHFIFNGKIYDQIDGVTMGSPLGPVLANLFMGHHEGKWVDSYSEAKPILYKRFMDDIFCIFKNENEAEMFFDYLNIQHTNIKFTFEKENANKLPFLDVNIQKVTDKTFQTSVYRKPTFTGLLTNFCSFIPFSYKLALIKTLIHRVYSICSSWQILHENLIEVENILKRNSYPPKLIDKEIRNYLNKQFLDDQKGKKENKKSYFKLPYIGSISNDTKTKITQICQKYCKELKIELCFSLFKTGSLFSVKDSIPSEQRSFVVYLFTCAGCNASYIGETTRHLFIRMDEHFSSNKGSVIYEHICENRICKDACDKNSFKIIDTANSEFRLKIKEAIHIALKKPTLNKQIKHERLNIII